MGTLVLRRELDDARDVFRGVGENDQVRTRFFDRAVVLVEDEILELVEDIRRAEQGVQFAE